MENFFKVGLLKGRIYFSSATAFFRFEEDSLLRSFMHFQVVGGDLNFGPYNWTRFQLLPSMKCLNALMM